MVHPHDTLEFSASEGCDPVNGACVSAGMCLALTVLQLLHSSLSTSEEAKLNMVLSFSARLPCKLNIFTTAQCLNRYLECLGFVNK